MNIRPGRSSWHQYALAFHRARHSNVVKLQKKMLVRSARFSPFSPVDSSRLLTARLSAGPQEYTFELACVYNHQTITRSFHTTRQRNYRKRTPMWVMGVLRYETPSLAHLAGRRVSPI